MIQSKDPIPNWEWRVREVSRSPGAKGGWALVSPPLPGSEGENKHLLSSLPVWHLQVISLKGFGRELKVEALGLRLTSLARVINRLVSLQKEVPPARGEEKVDALNISPFR